jgi:hypothetical protein
MKPALALRYASSKTAGALTPAKTQMGAGKMEYRVTYNADEVTARMVVIQAANALPEMQRSRIIRGIYSQPVEPVTPTASDFMQMLAVSLFAIAVLVIGSAVFASVMDGARV